VTPFVTAENIKEQAGLIEEYKKKLNVAINQLLELLHVSPLKVEDLEV